MTLVFFLSGAVVGACLTAIAGLLWEIRETRADLDVIRRDAERRHASALVDRFEARRENARWN